MSPIFLLLVATLPSALGQCTTSKCQEQGYEPPRWENGAVYLENLLAQTSDRILKAVQEALETRQAAQTAALEDRLTTQTASLESRLAAQTASLAAETTALEDRLAVPTAALQEKMASLEGLLTAATQDIGALVTAFQNASSQMAKCCESPATTATLTQPPATTPTSTVKPSTTPGTTEIPSTTPSTTKIPMTTPTTTETPLPVVFLRRQDGTVDFYQGWAAYKSGFGNLAGEFWLGLDNLHTLTTGHNYSLRVDLTDWSGETKWAVYSTFRVAGEGSGYRLTFSGFNPASTAGNSMWKNNGARFSTRDRDNDGSSISSCADYLQGAWWYGACTHANPTGPYKPAGYREWQGIYWYDAYGDLRSFRHITLTLVSS